MNTIPSVKHTFLVKSIFCVLFMIKSMVLALDLFLNNQLFCLYWQNRPTEKPTELA